MAEFSFDEFVNSIKSVNVENVIERKKEIIRLTLNAMDIICPNSYMPYVFIYANAFNCLHFVDVKKQPDDRSPYFTLTQQELINSFFERMKQAAVPFAKDGETIDDNFVISHLEELATKVVVGFDLQRLLTTKDKDAVFAWDFHGYDEINDEDDPQGSGYYNGDSYHRIKNAINILKEHDPFFTMDIDKYSYFELISNLKWCFLPYPKYDPYISDIDEAITYYREVEGWQNFYDKLIMDFYAKHNPSYSPVPEGITRIVNGLLHDEKGSEYDTQYDPFNNMGAFALNVNAQMSNLRAQESPHSFICDKTDDETACAITVRLLFRDCYVEFESKFSDKLHPNFIAMPPSENHLIIDGKDEDPISYSIQKGMKYVRHGCKMICIVPSTALLSTRYEESREMLVNSKHLTRIVLLPEKMFPDVEVATSVIYVDGSRESDSIKFVDASEYVEPNGNVEFWSIANLCFHDECPVSPEEREWEERNHFEFGPEIWNEDCHLTDGRATEAFGDREDFLTETSFENDVHFVNKSVVKENGYSLNPSLYFDRQIIAPEGFKMVRLSEMLTPAEFRVEGVVKGSFVAAKDLQQDFASQELKTELLPVKSVSKDYLVIEPGTSVLATKVGSLHPTVAYTDKEFYADARTVQAYAVKENSVNANYLINEMHKDYFNALLHYTRMLTHRNRNLSLHKLKVQVPVSNDKSSSLEVQREIVEKDLVARMDVLDEQLRKLNDQRFNEYVMALRQRKHRLSQILNQVCPAFSLLNKTREKNAGILKDTDVVASRTGENVAQYFGKVQQGLDKIERLIETFVDKNQWGKAEKFALEDFVSEFTQKHICKNYKLQLLLNNISGIDDVDNNENLAKRMVNMPKDELSTVFENIIANAETWGFNDENRDDYVIRISLGDADNGEHAVVTIANNGTPIHPSVDRDHIFDWGVGNHTGVGTWQAKNIVEHYGGHIRINEYPDAKDGFKTEYEMTLQREY